MELDKNISDLSKLYFQHKDCPKIYMTYEYFKEKIKGKKIINQIFSIEEKIGEGSFWTVFKVERNTETSDHNENKDIYALKEGNLNFVIPDDHIIYDNNNHLELNIKEGLNVDENDLDLIELSSRDKIDFSIEEQYKDKNIEKGLLFLKF